jgi:aspartate 1-decarboxylase
VTEADIEYVGSLTLDRDLMDAADLRPFERVEVYNVTGGERFSTYIIEGPRASGKVCINGAAAHRARPGDRIIIAAYCRLEEHEFPGFVPRLVFVDEKNRPVTLAELKNAGVNAPVPV